MGPLDFVFQCPDGEDSVVGVIAVVLEPVFGIDRYPEIHDKAAAILDFLILDHLMVEGNKRFAMATTEVFLKNNGYGWNLTKAEYVEIAVKIADPVNRMSLDEVRRWMAGKIYNLK